MNFQNWSSGGALKKRCNLTQNMQILFEVLAQLPSTTTETELGFYHYRWNNRVATKRKCPADQILEITPESCKKSLPKHFTETLILLNFDNFSVTFCPRLFTQKICQHSLEKYMRGSLYLKKVASFHPDTLLEKILVRLFSGDFSDIFKEPFLVELLRVTVSKTSLSRKHLVFLTKCGFY